MTTDGAVSRFRSATTARRCLVFLLLALFAAQVILTWRELSPGPDDAYVSVAGYLFLKIGRWFPPEHPPLAFALCALPLLTLNPTIDVNDPYLARDRRNLYNVGLNFLALNNDDERIFVLGRIPVLLLALLLGYFVYRWAGELYGGKAGLLALLLYSFSPTFVAHSGVITGSYDIALTCFSTLSLYWFWRFLSEGSWHNLLWTGFSLGCALASKTPSVLLPPLLVGLGAIAAWRTKEGDGRNGLKTFAGTSVAFPLAARTRGSRLVLSMAALAVAFALAFGVLYTVFLFPSDPLFYVHTVLRILRGPQLWPADYLYYLFGHFRTGGWWYYFLAAFAIKTPIPLLLLIPLAFWHWWKKSSGWLDEAVLLLPAAAYVVLISAMAMNIGVRYLFPALPLLFIFISRTASVFTQGRVSRAAGVVLVAWYLSTPLRVHPDYLAYFNELVGGPRHGIEYLDDSNLDWGQQLKRIQRYIDERQLQHVKLVYGSSMGRLDYYRVRAQPMETAVLARPPEPGVTYIVGAWELVRAKEYFHVDWLKQYPVVDRIGYSVFVFRVP